jgi:hypothetical protein
MTEIINNTQELKDIEAQWDEEDPKIIEVAKKMLEEERSTEEEREKLKKVQLQRGREREYNYEAKQDYLFYKNLPKLIRNYSGLYVWFEDGEVKDCDLDEVTLCGRVVRSETIRARKLNAIYVNKVPEIN